MGTDRAIADIVADVKGVLDTIAGPLPAGGAGKVFDRPRHTTNQEEFKNIFLDSDDKYRGTEIEVGTPNEFEDEARHKYWVIWPVRLTHWFLFSDEANSFQDFQKQVEKIKDTLRADNTVFRVPFRPEAQRVAQVETMDEVMRGGFLCHRAVIVADVETSELITP